jgi:hypothetical protein
VIKSGHMDYLEKFITDNFHGWTAFGMIIFLLVAVFLLVEVIRNAVKYRYDKKLEEHKAKLNQDKDSAKLQINADLSNKPRMGQPFLGFGPQEIILGDLTFHVLKAYNNFPSQNAAMSVDMVGQYCQITRDEALAAVKELHKMKYIRTLITAPGEWNGHFQITPIGRDYVMRHAT